VTNIFYILC